MEQPFVFKQENLDTMPLIFLKLKSDGLILYANQYSSSIIGYQAEELIGKKFYKVFTPNVGLEKAKNDLKIIAQGVPEGTTFNNWSRTKEGKHIYIEWRISYLDRPNQDKFNFLAYGIEITQNYKDEILSEAKAKIGASLNKSTSIQQLLRRSLKCFADFALLDFGFVDNSDPVKEEEACLAWFCQDLKHGKQALQAYKDAEEKKNILENLEINVSDGPQLFFEDPNRTTGEAYHKLIYYFPTTDEGEQTGFCYYFFFQPQEQRPKGFITSFFDDIEEMLYQTFERIKDKERIEAAKEKAEKANKIKDAFVASVSHEIRTPLNAILGHAQMLQRDNLSEDVNKSISIINSSGNHLVKLLNEVLNNASLESGKVRVTKIAFNLLDLIIEVRDTFMLKLKEKDLEFILEYSLALPQIIFADRDKLKQILINLISNAIKFTSEGTIKVSVQFIEHQIKLSVEDTGAGIPKKQLANVFNQYEKSSKHENAEGIGLGLSITKRLVRLLKATIEVESEECEGSCFNIMLPYDKPSMEKLSAFKKVENEAITLQNLKVKGPAPTILVIDDHLDSLNLVADLLNKMDFDLFLASSVKDAEEIIKSEEIDLIILDIVMPDVNGVTFLKHHKKYPKLRNTPIVVVSGDAEPDQIDSALNYGAVSFISKPFDHDRLVSLIEDLLDLEFTYTNDWKDDAYKAKLIKLFKNIDRELIERFIELSEGGEVSELKTLTKERINDATLKKFIDDTIKNLNFEYLSMLLNLVLQEK